MPERDPLVARRMQESTSRSKSSPLGRERGIELLVAGSFVAAAIAFPILARSDVSFDPGICIALVALYALGASLKFRLGSFWTDASQIAFVPMLFLVPAPAIPLLVAGALLVARTPLYVRGEISPDRIPNAFTDSWYAFGPAAVFAIAGVQGPDLGEWPIYLAALLAQFAVDLAVTLIIGRLAMGATTRELLTEISGNYQNDALLSAVGLIVASAVSDQTAALVLVVPLMALIAIFSREREARIENALTLSQAYRGTAHLLGEVLSASDEYTGKHSRSVVVFAHQVGEHMGLNEMELREIEFGALLHDVGKLSVPNEVLNKPGSLSEDEWRVMQTHTAEGERMLERIGGVLGEVGQIVRSHHERWDGTGYPDGLRGEEIPVASRVISCCDAFHAMTSDRSYRMAMSRDAAIEELRANAGTQFDPQVVTALISVVCGWDVGPYQVEPGVEAREALRDLATAG